MIHIEIEAILQTNATPLGARIGQGFLIFSLLALPLESSAQSTFTKITTGPIPMEIKQTSGVAWGDYDGDGWFDLFVAGFRSAPNEFFRNNRDGTFSRLTGLPFTDDLGLALPAAWADYDNDGDLDLFLGLLDGINHLYQNDGRAGFIEMDAQAAGSIVLGNHVSSGLAWADYDNDGWLDLFIANGAFTRDEPDMLHRNLGNGSFTNVAVSSGINQSLRSVQGIWADIDNDGDQDLFVTHRNQPNHLYLNRGDGTFQAITSGHVLNETAPSTGAAWGDYDNDGLLDLCVVTELTSNPQPIKLYRNLGQGEFEKITTTIITEEPAASISCAWVDYDNDGWLDLFVTDRQFNRLYRNNGDGSFHKITELPAEASANSGAFAWADYNNDGFPDLMVSNGASEPQANFLYRNNGNANRWLKLRFRGAISNRSAVGTKVQVRSVIGGKMLWQTRQLTAGEGWASQGPLEIIIGLGDANSADLLRVQWPSGVVQEIENVSANQLLMLVEPAKLAWEKQADDELRLNISGGKGNTYRLEESTDLIHWMDSELVLEPNEDHSLTAEGAQLATPHQFYRAALSQVELLASLSPTAEPPELPEGLAVDPEGNIYAGIITSGEVRKFTPEGEASTFVQLPGSLAGLDSDSEGNIYISVVSTNAADHGIWRITPGAEAELFAQMPLTTLPNDVVIGPGGQVYLTDSIGGAVFRLSSEGAVETWASHKLLLGIPNPEPPHPPFPIGANGLAFVNGNAFVGNTDRGTITRIPINEDGTAGNPVLFLEHPLLEGFDGVIADGMGNLHKYHGGNSHFPPFPIAHFPMKYFRYLMLVVPWYQWESPFQP